MNRTLLATLALLLTATALPAQQVVTKDGKAYRTHTVAKGEGFYRLALDNGCTQEDILAANPQLRTTGLVEGVKVLIPMRSAAQARQYTVKRGDTAFGIAKRHGLTLEQLYALNPGAKTSMKPGDVLKLADTPTNAPPTTPTQQFALHTIAPGETLYAIARRYGVKPQQLLDANIAIDPAALPVGSTIRVPASTIPDGDEHFTYHRVAPGETLFQLTVKHNVPQATIEALNPGLDWNALQVGQIVAVPKPANDETTTTYTQHTVAKRETLYSIATGEGISVEQLTAANVGLSADNLKRGMTIRIPHVTTTHHEASPATTDPAYIGTADDPLTGAQPYDYAAEGRPTIGVLLMLPFQASHELTEMRKAGVSLATGTYPFASRRYVEFYEGVRLALDSLAQTGANIDLRVADCSTRLQMLNTLQTLKNKPDLIIGPAKREGMSDVLLWAQTHQVPVVLPFAQADSAILDNPYAFQASRIDSISSRDNYLKQFDNLANTHIVMVSAAYLSPRDKKRAELFASSCQKRGLDVQNFTYNVKDPRAFLPCLQIDKRNVVILETTNEAQVNSIITSMSGVIEQKDTAHVELWATSAVLAMQTIEAEVFHKLNTHVFSTFGLDERNPDTRRVMNLYRQRYFTEPIAFQPYFSKLKKNSGFSEYGLYGYDVALQFVGARLHLGPAFVRRINDYRPPLTQTNFQFRNITNWGGHLNVGLKLLVFRPSGEVAVSNL